MTVAALGKIARARPNVGAFAATRGEQARSFGLPPGVDYGKIEEAGWGVIFFEEAPREVVDALKPLLDRRKAQAGALFKTLSYRRGEETRDWRRRYNVTPGSLDPQAVPYYLLIVGPPDQIPFEFQYLLGVDFAVGRLTFDQIADYERYAASIVAYEEPGSAPINGKEVVYWGTRHPGDEATELSATELVTPLARGVAGATPRLAKPVNEECAFVERLLPVTTQPKRPSSRRCAAPSRRLSCSPPRMGWRWAAASRASTKSRERSCARIGKASAASAPTPIWPPPMCRTTPRFMA
ncbi:MAG TPA: hypothetical protein VIF40_19145 [Methylosinus sp.]|jgi:hypothetical protein|uniref:hypothetical protein n=1 Tax=Methylosinus sp. TaxID=427 RepID=UPI002F92E4DC